MNLHKVLGDESKQRSAPRLPELRRLTDEELAQLTDIKPLPPPAEYEAQQERAQKLEEKKWEQVRKKIQKQYEKKRDAPPEEGPKWQPPSQPAEEKP